MSHSKPAASIRSPKHLLAWAIGRPIALAMPAHDMAVTLPVFREMCEFYRSGFVAEKVGARIPPAEVWLSQYREPERVKRRLLEIFFGGSSVTAQRNRVNTMFMAGALKSSERGYWPELQLRRMAELPYPIKRQLRAEIENGLQHQFAQHMLGLSEALNGDLGDGGVDLDEVFSQPEPLFMMGVILPCIMAYGELPWTLYESARQGDYQAIDKLVRVDKLVLHDEVIRDYALKLGPHGNTTGRELAADALRGTAKYPIDQKTINYMGCGLLARTAETLGLKLSTKDLRELLDAAAKDRTGDPLAIETDFADSPEAERKAIDRYKRFWDRMLGRDIDFDFSCHEEFGFFTVVSDAYAEAARPTWLPPESSPETSSGHPTEGRQDPRRGWWSGVVPSVMQWSRTWGRMATGLLGRFKKR